MESGIAEKAVRPNFKRAYKQLKTGDRLVLRSVIMEKLNWSPTMFELHKNGDRLLSPIEKDVVVTSFRLMGLDAFSGEPISHESK